MDSIILKEIDFHITNKCNMNCLHCLYDSGKELMEELSLFEIEKIIKEYSKISEGKGNINLFGGEIFLRKDIFNIFEILKNERLKFGIITNGRFNENILKKIIEYNPNRLTFDLDGGTSKTHDWLRNREGSFDETIAMINKFTQNKINVSITTVLNKKNINEIDILLDLCKKLKLSSISFFLMTPLGRGEKLHDYVLNGEEWLNAKKKITNWIKNNNPKFTIIWENAFIEKNEIKYLKPLCNNFKNDVLNIKCNGDVFFCGLLASKNLSKIGNIKNESLKEIIHKAKEKKVCMNECFILKKRTKI